MSLPDQRPKTVLLPGASRPLGRAIARKFASHGFTLLLPLYHDWPESNQHLADELTQRDYQFTVYPCDLTNRAAVRTMFDQITAQYPVIDYLINNIERGGMPIMHGSYYKEINSGQWELEAKTTIKAKQYLYENALPLLKNGPASAIVNITSIASITGRAGPVSPLFSDGYAVSNSGVSLLTKTWAREAAPEVRVNEAMIGIINGRHGAGTKGWALLSSAQQERIKSHTLLRRIGDPAEIADLVYFLSVTATYLTGSTVIADGGYILGGEEHQELPAGWL